MEEYIHAKSKHALDFQMRMINSPLNQCTKTKLRDKGYQHLDSSLNSKLELKDLTEICLGRRKKESILIEILNEDDSKDLRCAYLLTKSVPRRTNREKWKVERKVTEEYRNTNNSFFKKFDFKAFLIKADKFEFELN